MTAEDTLQIVLSKLDVCRIPYMITGSFGSNMFGVPRATQDADIVIHTNRRALDGFIKSLGDEFYVSAEAAREALEKERIFNVVHLNTGFKVDLIVRKSRPFSKTEFSRRKQSPFLGRDRWFATPEDIILCKLEWAKMGNSERHFSDALNVAKIQKKGLDREYIRRWSEELNVGELVEKLFKEIDSPNPANPS
jgi:hypothetical protein